MPKKLNLQQFINKANLKHNFKYDYSEVEYINSSTKVKIICKEHGEFLQAPGAHIFRSGCPFCGGKTLNTKVSIERLIKVHGDRYDYSKAIFIADKIKMEIICKKHGSFFQTHTSHLAGFGCKKCRSDLMSKTLTQNKEEAIKDFQKIHGNRYDYSEVNYEKSNKKVLIICNHCNTKFKVTPASHKSGTGCSNCSVIQRSKKLIKSKNILIDELIKIHGNKYNYDLLNYKGAHYPVNIKCNSCCKIFSSRPNSLLKGSGCSYCAHNFSSFKKEDWVNNAKIKNKQGTFYILRCWNEDESFYKAGITYNSIKVRYGQKLKMTYNYEIIEEI